MTVGASHEIHTVILFPTRMIVIDETVTSSIRKQSRAFMLGYSPNLQGVELDSQLLELLDSGT